MDSYKIISSKILLFSFLTFIFLSCNNSKNIDESKHLKTDKIYQDFSKLNDILKDIYGSKSFDSFENIVWQASSIDFPEIPISYDKKYHTSVDTVMYFTDNNKNSCALFILANYNIQIEKSKEIKSGGHFDPVSLGVALFIKSKKGWELYRIKKHLTNLGYGGIYRTGRNDAGKIYLKKIGENWTCLVFKQGIGGNTGEFWGNERLFSVEKNLPMNCIDKENFKDEIDINEYQIFSQLFSYNYHHNYYFPDLDNQNSIDIELKTKSNNPCDLYDFQLIINEVNYNIETNKTNSIKKSIREFKYSEKLNVYLETNSKN